MRNFIICFFVGVQVRRAVMRICSQGRNADKGTLCKCAREVLASISSPFLPSGNIISYINLYKILGASGVCGKET